MGLRVLIVAESFLPSVNGVTNSVLHVAEHLVRRGHRPVIVAPEPAPAAVGAVPVLRLASRDLPIYRGLPVSRPSAATVDQLLDEVQPDVVHLAAPTVLGARFAERAQQRRLPIVALFQTDLAGFARSYHLGLLSPLLWRWLRRIHCRADITLVPSSATAAQLNDRNIPRVGVWARGVDHHRFNPNRRSDPFRQSILASSPPGTVVVGYVGRLAREKQVDLLRAVAGLDGVRLMVVGDGPDADRLRRRLPNAHFTGMLRGDELAEAVASLDVFVHTGAHETFGQSIQEAMACGIPVVAPASGGPLDLVEPGVTGFLYRPGRSHELAAAVASLVADPVLRRQFGVAGLVKTRDRTWEHLGDELVDIYQRCLRDGDRRTATGRAPLVSPELRLSA